ncbi:MAG TPA: hypothetical protein VK586_16540, partial [Streptosporangiaceae bacterium]|nr:hypothetical protein [Streptosporangiaceae bacterium]
LVQGPVPALVGSAGVTLAVGYGASAATGSRLAGVRAGLACAVVGALAHFAVDAVVLLTVSRYTLATPHDVAQYHSGALNLASYVIGDALAGALFTGLLIYPAVLAGAALVGSAAAGRGAPAVRAHSC